MFLTSTDAQARDSALRAQALLAGAHFMTQLYFKLSNFLFLNFLLNSNHFMTIFRSCTQVQFCLIALGQGILKGKVSLYHWPPVWLVWNQLYDNLQFLFLFEKQTNPNQSNRRSMVQRYFPLYYSLPRCSGKVQRMSLLGHFGIYFAPTSSPIRDNPLLIISLQLPATEAGHEPPTSEWRGKCSTTVLLLLA